MSRNTDAPSREARLLRSGPVLAPSPRSRWQVEHFSLSPKNKALPLSKSPPAKCESPAGSGGWMYGYFLDEGANNRVDTCSEVETLLWLGSPLSNVNSSLAERTALKS